ncbi:MAG TPA: hypothetical protein VK453_24555 [Micromonosporaceae bacterium]|nr:hypothetical protein [Micromonosporaceae bacterium]
MADVRAPRCPGCDQPPLLAFERQAFCGNDACQVLTWNKTEDPARFKANAVQVNISYSGRDKL